MPLHSIARPSHPARLLLGVLAAFLILVAQRPALAQALTPEQRDEVMQRAQRMVEGRAFAAGVDFKKRWPEILEKYKERIERAEDVNALSRVLNRALSEIGISHLELVPPSAAKNLNKTTIAGIGITSEPAEGGVRIVRLVPGAPAEKAGLKLGETVIEIDGKPHQSVDQIRGPAGTKVKLKLRDEEGAEREVTITRAEFSTRDPETIENLADDAAVLTIPTFSAGYDRANIQKLIESAREKPFIIVDLRNNGGGDFSNMVHFLSCFLPPGSTIGTQVSRSMTERYAESTGKDPADAVAVAAWADEKVKTRRSLRFKPYEGRVAVLINRASASASEIVAAALRELRAAPLVGSQTAGAVLVSQYSNVGEGFMMKVPLSEWITIKGVRLEGNPLVADVQVNATPGRRARNPQTRSQEATAPQKALDRLRELAKADEKVEAKRDDSKVETGPEKRDQ
ncbi:MAG: S41 family peptidase [Phycisphaerales bacterium]